MRVAAVAHVAEAILADIFIQCIESVQHSVYRRASSATDKTRRALLSCSPR